MTKFQNWLKGYKMYLMLLAYAAFVLITGHEPAGAEGVIAGFDNEAVEKALTAAVIAAGKAAWNRRAESN